MTNLLTASRVFSGTLLKFGSADVPDAVECSGQTVTLTQGLFSSLVLLGTAVEGNQASQTLIVNYTDGTSTKFVQSFSDWFTPQKYHGEIGLPFAFAHHFSPANTLPALALYRSQFRPSEVLDRPYAMVAAAVVCAETDERAHWLAGGGAVVPEAAQRPPRPAAPPEEAAAYPYNELERAFVADRQATQVIGAPATVRRGLADLLTATAADELMLTTMVFDPADRLRSFELVADLARISQPLDARNANSTRKSHEIRFCA